MSGGVDAGAFLTAVRAGNIPAVEEMLKKDPKLTESCSQHNFAVHFAAVRNDVLLINAIAPFKPDWNKLNEDGVTPLGLAARGGLNAAIQALVAHGADVNKPGEARAGKKGMTAAHEAALAGRVDTLRLLASLGAKVAEAGVKGGPTEAGTVLHCAVENGSLAAIDFALYGAKVPIDAPNSAGETPLVTALSTASQKGGNHLVQVLLEHGAAPTRKALECALAGNAEAVKLLVAFGAVVDAKDMEKAKAEPSNAEYRELTRAPRKTGAEATAEGARLKTKGNEVFGKGENVKAAKFYSLAIQLEPANHVYFSNRSACHYNIGHLDAALLDGRRCVALSGGKWPKGFLRVGATLGALGQLDAALAACDEGLAVDKTSAELNQLRTELTQKLGAKR